MLRGFVRHRRDYDDTTLVRGIDRLLRLHGVRQRAECFLHHIGTGVQREHHARREPSPLGDERVGDADREQPAVRAIPDIAGAVLARVGVLGLAGAVPVLHRVERIVVAVEEVPPGDVVDVTVVIVVDTVAERGIEDQIFGIGDTVSVAVGHAREVADVEDAVAVAVATARTARRLRFTDVDVRGGREIGHAIRAPPHDPGVEHRDEHVVTAFGDAPREVDGRSLLPALVLR